MGIAMGYTDDVPHIVPIYEVYALTHTIIRLDLDDRDTTGCLRNIFTYYEDIKLALILKGYLFLRLIRGSTKFQVVDGFECRVFRLLFREPFGRYCHSCMFGFFFFKKKENL